MTYHLTTYGCQMNISDSERISAVLERNLGLKRAPEAKADILIFNLCSVRQSAVNRVWGNFKKTARKHRPLIIFTGCILPPDKEKISLKNGLVLDIKDLPLWPEIIKQEVEKSRNQKNKKTNMARERPPLCRGGAECERGRGVSRLIPSDYLSIPPAYSSPFTAYVPIMTGCNNFCSYCAVPYTRGREVSRPVAEILTEISDLISRGYKEIILLGQNVNSYQGKLNPQARILKNKIFNIQYLISHDLITFPSLLRLIDQIKGNYWLTFFTSHPKDLSPELIACFKNSEHLLPYLHLALQSGSDQILKAMNRKYTAQHFINLIKKVRLANPHVCVSTDIIVGFPGETTKNFLATAALMKKVRFDMAYLAEYSPRPLTAAARLKDSVTKAEKQTRKNELNEILKNTALANNQKMIGQTTDILISSADNNHLFGRTKNFKNVKIITTSNKKLVGQFIKVKITKATAWNLEGELISVGSGL